MERLPISSWRLAYTWSKTDRLFPKVNRGLAFPAKYDRTHIVNANASVRMLTRDRMNLSLASLFTYQSGHLETVHAGSWWDDTFVTGEVEKDFYTSINNFRMPPYIADNDQWNQVTLLPVMPSLKWSVSF